MSATLLDGAALAEKLREQIAIECAGFTVHYGRPPGLGFVLVGDNPASAQYVRMKRRACDRVGITSFAHLLAGNVDSAAVAAAVADLNADERVDGILVQLPLPPTIDEAPILAAVALEKDVDGFHPINIGAIGMKGREPTFTPATPTGIMALLRHSGTPIAGMHAVVVGRSNIVGLPVALMLLKADATVTVCHSRTQTMQTIVRTGDIVIAAAGVPQMITGDWLKPGAVVIDVGTNAIPDESDPRGYRYVGDVAFESARQVAGGDHTRPRRRRTDDDHDAACQHAQSGSTADDASEQSRDITPFVGARGACYTALLPSAPFTVGTQLPSGIIDTPLK